MVCSFSSCASQHKVEEVLIDATMNTSDEGLGEMEHRTYVGDLPSASGSGILYRLTINNRQYSGDGTFHLSLTYKGADSGKDKTFEYSGKRFTQRGIPGDDNATVWQCVSDNKRNIFNFLRENDSTLLLLNDKFEKPESKLNYRLNYTIPYVVATNYFIKNNVDTVPETVDNESDFQKYFGMAAVMGDGGTPTAIDFNKQFVIIASLPATDIDTNLTPIFLQKENGELVFTCNKTFGKKQSYTIHPFVMIVVDRQYFSPVSIKWE